MPQRANFDFSYKSFYDNYSEKEKNMPDQSPNQKIIINEVEYDATDLSDIAKEHIAKIEFIDSQILQLNNEWAVADTARIGYLNALNREANS